MRPDILNDTLSLSPWIKSPRHTPISTENASNRWEYRDISGFTLMTAKLSQSIKSLAINIIHGTSPPAMLKMGKPLQAIRGIFDRIADALPSHHLSRNKSSHARSIKNRTSPEND